MWFIFLALATTFLLSRLSLFLSRKICGKKMYVTSNVLSLVIAAILFALAGEMSDFMSGFVQGLIANGLVQFVWLAFDFIKFGKETKQI